MGSYGANRSGRGNYGALNPSVARRRILRAEEKLKTETLFLTLYESFRQAAGVFFDWHSFEFRIRRVRKSLIVELSESTRNPRFMTSYKVPEKDLSRISGWAGEQSPTSLRELNQLFIEYMGET